MSGKDRPLQQLSSNAITAKELARSLGLVKKTLSSSTSRKKAQREIRQRQSFTYLIVLDFESTCWKDKKMNYGPEIIEFPAVLLNTSTGELESEFHMFVQPIEHTKLSEFCRELTGITQAQVDDGVPIGTCLMLFGRWLQEMKEKKGFKFPCEQVQKKDEENNAESLNRWCTFVTWSDWDLGTCLKNECRRKQLRMPHPLRSWIDLRATYKNFYSRKPQGLAGALQDLGIKFCGREHSGLDDARNTARLAWRMISDGCIMQITKSIDGMLEKLWEIVAQSVDSQRDSSSKEHVLKCCSDKKSNALTVQTKPQVKPSPTLDRNLHGSLDFSSLPAENRVKSDLISGPLRKRNTGVKSRILGSGVGYPSVKLTAIKDKDKLLKIQGKEAKTDEELRAMTVVPGLKRSAPHNTACTTLISTSSESSTGGESAPTSLITPSTCLPSLNKRARECYGDFRGETPKSSTTGLLFKKGLAKQTLSEKKHTAVGCSDGQVSIGIGQSESKTNKQPCKPSNIEPRPVTTPSLRLRVKPASVRDEQRQKQDLKKDNNCITYALASHTADSQKPETHPTPTIYSVRLGKPFTTPMGNPRPFTSPSLLKTNVNSPVTPPLLSFNGGGVTPPLCQCGRRARRRCVVNPGPNQGRAFFTCLFNHGRSGLGSNVGKKKSEGGCKFFRWEVRL